MYLKLLIGIELQQNTIDSRGRVSGHPDVMAAPLEGIRDATAPNVLAGGWKMPESVRELAGRTGASIRATVSQHGLEAHEAVSLVFSRPPQQRTQ